MGFLRHLEVLPKARKAACIGSPCFGLKPRRLFLEELLPSRAPLRFVDGAKIRLVFVPSKFRQKKQPTFCPLGLFVSKTAYFLSITPTFPCLSQLLLTELGIMVSCRSSAMLSPTGFHRASTVWNILVFLTEISGVICRKQGTPLGVPCLRVLW